MQHFPVSANQISRAQLVALSIATVAAGAVAAIGMLASFHTVSTQMQPSFKGWAWTVPVTLDMTISSFSILELVLLRMALPHMPARLAVYAATAATVYLNTRGVSAGGDRAQLIAHAAMPAVWALYIEVLRAAAAALTRRERRTAEHPAVAFLLAPVPVLTAWRRDILGHHATPRARKPKMSAARGHFPCSHRHDHATRACSDIFPESLQAQTVGRTSMPADDTPGTTPASAAAGQPMRIGKGRGLTGRYAVLDLAHRHPELTNAQIAQRLHLSPRTVRRHLGHR
jgi:AraC-like DNA-binding protein